MQLNISKRFSPILALHEEAGSAKSTAARVLKSCVNSTTVPLRSRPRNEHDLVIAAQNPWTIDLDNLSSLPVWLPDALCRLATGGKVRSNTHRLQCSMCAGFRAIGIPIRPTPTQAGDTPPAH